MSAQLPVFDPWPAAAASTAIRRLLAKQPLGTVHRFDFRSPAPLAPADCLTLHPFLMWILEGELIVHDQASGGAQIIGVGAVTAFQARSFTNVRHRRGAHYLRLSLHDDGLFIGEETIHATSRPPSPRHPAGVLRACWRGGPPSTGILALWAALGDAALPDSSAAALVHSLFVLCTQALASPPSAGASVLDDRQICRYLQAHAPQLDSREEAARACGMSGSQLARRLRRATGLGFQELVQAARLDRARHLLRHSSMSISEVATACGFSSRMYFTQVFKRVEGHTPSGWRNRQRPGASAMLVP